MVFREIAGRRDIIDEEIERYENQAYLNGLQDARDAMILMIQEIEKDLPENVKGSLYEFISNLSTDIQELRYILLKKKLFETYRFISEEYGRVKEKSNGEEHIIRE